MKTTNLLALAAVAAVALTSSSALGAKRTAAAPKAHYDIDIIARQVAEADAGAGVTAADDPSARTPYWVDLVNADIVPDGGKGVYVAVLDTGLLQQWTNYFPAAQIMTDWGKGYTHDLFWDTNANDIGFGPLRDDRGFITDPYMGSGHGTHVASTVIGYHFKTATADYQIRGVAPFAGIIPVLVLDAWEVPSPNGVLQLTGGFDDMIASGIRYIANLAVEKKIKVVINMSLGGPEPTLEIQSAIDYAIAKGVIVVASAGNSGAAGMGWPGAYPEVISAAAGGWSQQWITPPSRWWLNDVTEKLNTKDLLGNNWQIYLTDFSSRPNPMLGQSWKQLDVCAPGAAIVGPFKDYFSTAVGYYYLYGTSMAAPHVSAMAACVARYFPKLNQAGMQTALKRAAVHITMPSDGATVLDPVLSDVGLIDLKWVDHDYGTGFLTLDWALYEAAR
jgi:subtilisin family serine protease